MPCPPALSLQWIDAPYGRYQVKASPLWGMAVDNRVAWLLQELPSFAFAAWGWYTADPEAFGAANRVLLGLYLLHYTHRAWVFPLRMRGGKPTPLSVLLLAMVYCLVNGYLQSRFLAAHATFAAGWTEAPQFLAGVAMFFAGMYINMDADSILRNLRRGPADKGYYIPRVSCRAASLPLAAPGRPLGVRAEVAPAIQRALGRARRALQRRCGPFPPRCPPTRRVECSISSAAPTSSARSSSGQAMHWPAVSRCLPSPLPSSRR